MWTGDKVISKHITLESLQDINDVLKRHVVIWDNGHANDYDQVGPCRKKALRMHTHTVDIHFRNASFSDPSLGARQRLSRSWEGS